MVLEKIFFVRELNKERKMTKIELELPPVSVIIPAYNEQKWIKNTIESVLKSGFPCKLIVVDDGSTDKTPEILKTFGSQIKVISHSKNKGKGAAITSGIKASDGEIIVFLDAHLLGLNKAHFLSLVLPLVYNQAKVAIGVGFPKKIPLAGFQSPMWILSGQRAYFKKDLLPLLKKFETLGYGVEVFLYNQFKSSKMVVVPLPGLIHLIKKDTSSPAAATLGYLKEAKEIFSVLTKIENLTPKEFKQLKRTIVSLWQEYLNQSRKKAKKYLEPFKKFLLE